MPAFGLGGALGVVPATARMGGLRDPFPQPSAREPDNHGLPLAGAQE